MLKSVEAPLLFPIFFLYFSVDASPNLIKVNFTLNSMFSVAISPFCLYILSAFADEFIDSIMNKLGLSWAEAELGLYFS